MFRLKKRRNAYRGGYTPIADGPGDSVWQQPIPDSVAKALVNIGMPYSQTKHSK